MSCPSASFCCAVPTCSLPACRTNFSNAKDLYTYCSSQTRAAVSYGAPISACFSPLMWGFSAHVRCHSLLIHHWHRSALQAHTRPPARADNSARQLARLLPNALTRGFFFQIVKLPAAVFGLLWRLAFRVVVMNISKSHC